MTEGVGLECICIYTDIAIAAFDKKVICNGDCIELELCRKIFAARSCTCSTSLSCLHILHFSTIQELP